MAPSISVVFPNAGAPIIQIGADDVPRSRGISTLSSPAVILEIPGERVTLRRELRKR